MNDKNRCPEKVKYAVPWAGKILMGCPTHANDIVTIGRVIGSLVETRETTTDEPCFGQDDFKAREEAQAESSRA